VHILQIGNDVVHARGGTPLAIRDAQRALGGEIVSFTDPDLLPGAADGVLHVPHSSSWVGRRYGWSSAAGSAAADACFERCDVVLVHGLFRHHYGWAIGKARAHGKPYLVVPHGALDPYAFSYARLPKELWWQAVGRPGLRRAASVVFATARERDKAAARVTGVRSRVVHWPIEPHRDPPAGARERMRAALGIDAGHRALLFLGRLDAFKRVPELIDAFNRSAASNLHLIVAGPDGPSLTRADAGRRVAAPLRNRVHLLGAVYGEEKAAVLAAADGCVSISARENFGYALCECLAAGLPGLVGPGADLAPEFADADCGWLLARDDAAAVADAMTRFAGAPPEQLSAMGARGRDWVRRHLGLEAFRQALGATCAEAAQ